jgi:peptidoglycan/xylan/chitin deacetylase (PgdA/CDA1 family)
LIQKRLLELALASKEIVLTFDDGPWANTTPRILDALKEECVQGIFSSWVAMRWRMQTLHDGK